jgi:hypothetical protein
MALSVVDGLTSVHTVLPPADHEVIVQCIRYRTLGYVDAKGEWCDAAKHRELKEVVGWMEV